MVILRLTWFCLLFASVYAGGGARAQTETKSERDLKGLVQRQRELLDRAEEADDQSAMEDLRPQFQTLIFDYERFLRENPKYVPGYVSYGLLLGQDIVGEPKRAVALLLKANELDPNIPLVKNQIGNYLAEDGKPLEAINYYLSAAELAPDESLYHYQVGLLLTTARSDFETSGDWTRETLTATSHRAFKRAYELSPANFEYGYRFAQSFYDLAEPDWAKALAAWKGLEKSAGTELGRQAVRLQEANVMIHQGAYSSARESLMAIDDIDLRAQRDELLLQLNDVSGPREGR